MNKINNLKLNARIGKIWPKNIAIKATTPALQKVITDSQKK
jgi:hypothetical protein